MIKAVKYSFFILLFVALVSGGILFYLKKDGYQITFNSNGGSIVAPIQVGFKETALKPVDPKKEGYQFVGWYLDGEKFNFDEEITENITLKAEYEVIEEVTYTLSFDSLGGSEIEKMDVEENALVSDVPIPTKEGYQFVYWTYHNKEFSFSNPITHDMVLVAKYEKVISSKSKYTITFDSMGGSLVESLVVDAGSIAKMPRDPEREGYQFAGWYLDGEEFDFSKPIQSDITLEAWWVLT